MTNNKIKNIRAEIKKINEQLKVLKIDWKRFKKTDWGRRYFFETLMPIWISLKKEKKELISRLKSARQDELYGDVYGKNIFW